MSPAIDRLERLGSVRLTAANLPDVIKRDYVLILMTGNPQRVRETNDAAVIFPELVRAIGDKIGVSIDSGFVTPDQETDAVRAELGVLAYPSVVAYHQGRFAGVVPGMKAWSDYIATLSRFFEASAPAVQVKS